MCFAPQRRAFSTSQLPKVVREWCILYILTWKFASLHNGVHFLDISTSKSGPRIVCFVHLDLEMCFAPQGRALFRLLNFQKWSEREVFLAFSLTNVLRATTACTFSSLIWPDGSAPAALGSLLFDPSKPQIIGKTRCFATFLSFRAPVSSYFWLFLFSDLLSSALLFSLPLPISAFHLSILSEVWLLNFLRLSINYPFLFVVPPYYPHAPSSFLSFHATKKFQDQWGATPVVLGDLEKGMGWIYQWIFLDIYENKWINKRYQYM